MQGVDRIGLPDPLETSGVLGNLDKSLLELLAAYRPGSVGVCWVPPTMLPVLPVPDWSYQTNVQQGTATQVGAGVQAYQTIYTTPMDIRAWLYAFWVLRSAGDNEIDGLRLSFPGGYTNDAAEGTVNLVRPATAVGAGYVFWPDNGNSQTNALSIPGPILLEPGTQVELSTDGTGVSGTDYVYSIAMRQTKIVLAHTPL